MLLCYKVCYTDLDVYKRQVYAKGAGNRTLQKIPAGKRGFFHAGNHKKMCIRDRNITVRQSHQSGVAGRHDQFQAESVLKMCIRDSPYIVANNPKAR